MYEYEIVLADKDGYEDFCTLTTEQEVGEYFAYDVAESLLCMGAIATRYIN